MHPVIIYKRQCDKKINKKCFYAKAQIEKNKILHRTHPTQSVNKVE